MALRATAGLLPGVDADLTDAVTALRVLAGIVVVEGRAMLGPLSGADVKVFRLRNLTAPMYTTRTRSDGSFGLTLSGIASGEAVLVAVSGGVDTDANDDGVTDAVPTPNQGTIHALIFPGETGQFHVTAMSDIAWRYTENLLTQVEESGLKARLHELARVFFASDITGDGKIDAADLLAFQPTNPTHKGKLSFDFATLFADNADGNSIMDCYHRNLAAALPGLLEEKFWSRLTLIPAERPDYDKVKIEVARVGRGRVTSDAGGIDVDSQRADASLNVDHAFFTRSATGKVVLTAAPITGTEILDWRGCDAVSEDKTTCECSLKTDRLVSVTFGYKETVLKQGVTLVDLSEATVVAGEGQVTLDVTAGAGDTETVAKLTALKAGDIVVGSSGGGFLRSVVSKQKMSDLRYILTTGDASLEDVIAQGTGGLYKQMTHGDLAPEDGATARSGGSDEDGFRLVPSDDPNDRVFRMVIGNPRARENMPGELKWPPTGDAKVVLKGDVEVTIDVEWGFSLELVPPGIESVKFIPRIDASESLNLSVVSEVEASYEIPVGPPLKFAPITFAVGPVPVVVNPEVQVMLGIEVKAGGEVTAGITLKQMVRGGFSYNRGTGVSVVGEFDHSHEFTPPTLKAYASVTPYVKTKPVLYLYGQTGPAITLKGYLEVKGEMEAPLFTTDPCEGGIAVTAMLGLQGGFEWDLGSIKKLGKWAENAELEVEFTPYEVLLKKWNIDGVCANRPPFLEVAGLDLEGTVAQGSATPLTRQYTVKNTGNQSMEWRAGWFEDGVTTVSPRSGTIAPGQSTAVTVSVAAGGLRVGPYGNWITFDNRYDDGLLSGEPDGDATRRLSVTVTPPPLAGPVLAQPVMALDGGGQVIPSKVVLTWSYPDAATLKYVQGYTVWKASAPDQWQRVATNVTGSSLTVANLLPNTTYYFAVDAYGADVETGLSDSVSIKTPAVQTGGGDFTNTLGMTFNLIPAGAFTMGSPTTELGRYSDETQHQVTLTQNFYLMTTEVTQAQWQAVMGTNPSYFSACGGNCPVEQVSWNDVQTFITALNAREGKTYRLPTEAEWEYAARAGSATAFYNGAITNTGTTPLDPNLNLIGWYGGNSAVTYTPNSSGKGAHPVAGKQPNAFGLYDMSGNVWEWCQDWYGTYPTTAVTNPSGPATGSYRVLRGGSWSSDARGCRSAYRSDSPPSSRSYGSGFRLALSPGQ